MESLEQIALRVEEETDLHLASSLNNSRGWILHFAKRLVEALGNQKPVAWILPTEPPRIVDHMNFNANYGGTVTPLYAAPVVPETTALIVSEAKNLVAQKGRHNTEIAYGRLVAAVAAAQGLVK